MDLGEGRDRAGGTGGIREGRGEKDREKERMIKTKQGWEGNEGGTEGEEREMRKGKKERDEGGGWLLKGGSKINEKVGIEGEGERGVETWETDGEEERSR